MSDYARWVASNHKYILNYIEDSILYHKKRRERVMILIELVNWDPWFSWGTSSILSYPEADIKIASEVISDILNDAEIKHTISNNFKWVEIESDYESNNKPV